MQFLIKDGEILCELERDPSFRTSADNGGKGYWSGCSGMTDGWWVVEVEYDDEES